VGIYSRNISNRINHVNIKEGYCLICGAFAKLTQDHVPPKGSITLTKIEQQHVTEMMGVRTDKLKGVKSTNGSKFKTICQNCNNMHLGGNDDEISKVTSSLTAEIKKYLDEPFSINNHIVVPVQAKKYARAMIGHILSATSVDECKKPQKETPYFDPLRSFVLGNDEAINKTHDIYYWFYPHHRHVSAKYVGFRNNGHFASISLLSFYPLAFMVTEKDNGIYPAHASKMLLGDTSIAIDISPKHFSFSAFPFIDLKGDQIMLLSDHQAIVSYPIGTK
jgi:hypothetical protein